MKALASSRLTLIGLIWLALAVAVHYQLPGLPSWQLVLPFALLAVNLAVALLVKPVLRTSTGLFMFHLALLVLMLLAGWGKMTHLDGRVEVVEGQAFSDARVEITRYGAWHRNRLNEIEFVQGPYTIDYRPGLKRSHTRSEIFTGNGQSVVGDIDPLVLSGYRFYTTHNKGFALVVTWMPESGPTETGAIHLPSFPMNDWRQESTWKPSGGPDLKWMLDPGIKLDYQQPWKLDSRQLKPVLKLQGKDQAIELKPGQMASVPGGSLRFEGVRGWMGYRIFYDPTLPWLLACAIVSVLALAWHLLGHLALPKFSVKLAHERAA